MKLLFKIFLFCLIDICIYKPLTAQLVVIPESNGQALVQKLLGPGVTVSNVTLTGHPTMTGIFNNISGTNIGIDSGIVLTNGRAKSISSSVHGVDGDGINTALNVDAFNIWSLPGDVDLTAIVGDQTNDACVLEFDFVPLAIASGSIMFSAQKNTPIFPAQNLMMLLPF